MLWLQTGGLRGDGRLFVNTLEVADVTKVDAGLSFPSFIVDNGLFINMGGLLVSCTQAAPALCRMHVCVSACDQHFIFPCGFIMALHGSCITLDQSHSQHSVSLWSL